MPYLPDENEVTTRIVLPSTKELSEDQQLWVDIDAEPMRGLDMLAAKEFSNPDERAYNMLNKRIKAWNATDRDGVVREINLHTVSLLKKDDSDYLAELIVNAKSASLLSDEEKKN